MKYSVLDLRRSEFAGTNLDGRLVTAARQTIEAKIDKLAVNGNERIGLKGLCNHQLLNSHNLGKWFDEKGKAVKTSEQMLADVNQLVSVIAEETNNILFPTRYYCRLNISPISHKHRILQRVR